jgi:hypothetical protein
VTWASGKTDWTAAIAVSRSCCPPSQLRDLNENRGKESERIESMFRINFFFKRSDEDACSSMAYICDNEGSTHDLYKTDYAN